MSTDLRTQLATYGDIFAADLDTVTVEDAMTSRKNDGNVATLEPVERKEEKNYRGVWVAAAVFALVLAIGAIIGVASLGGSDLPPAVTTTVPVVEDAIGPPFESAEAAVPVMLETWENGTAEEFRALLSDDNVGFGTVDPNIPEIDERMRFDRMIGGTAEIVSCSPNSRTSVTCDLAFSGSQRDIMLFGTDQVRAEATVRINEAGLISSSNWTHSIVDPPFDLSREFSEWVDAGNTVGWFELDPYHDSNGQLDKSPEEAASFYLGELARFLDERG